jgi:hypothetical protein
MRINSKIDLQIIHANQLHVTSSQHTMSSEPAYILENGKRMPYVPIEITTHREAYAATMHVIFKHVADFHICVVKTFSKKYGIPEDEIMQTIQESDEFKNMAVDPVLDPIDPLGYLKPASTIQEPKPTETTQEQPPMKKIMRKKQPSVASAVVASTVEPAVVEPVVVVASTAVEPDVVVAPAVAPTQEKKKIIRKKAAPEKQEQQEQQAQPEQEAQPEQQKTPKTQDVPIPAKKKIIRKKVAPEKQQQDTPSAIVTDAHDMPNVTDAQSTQEEQERNDHVSPVVLQMSPADAIAPKRIIRKKK